MGTKTKVIISIVLLATAVAVGRYTVPVRIKTETKIVEVEKKTDTSKTEKDQNKHRETTIKEILHPDGTKETTTIIVEDTETNKSIDRTVIDDKKGITHTITQIVRSTGPTLSALAGMDLLDPKKPIFGGHISQPVLGPISIGVWGLSSGVGGVSVGLAF